MTLRPYQQEAVRRVFEHWESGKRRVALVLPTGAGKTVTFTAVIRRFLDEHGGGKVLMLAHRSELLDQAAGAIRRWAPDLRVGLVQAGMNQVSADVIVASQQTLARSSRLARMPEVGLVVVDECHRSSGPSYMRVLEGLGCMTADGPRTLGVTATFTREDSRRLTDFYESVPYSLDILDLILHDPPYLVTPRFKRVLVEGLDLSGVPISRNAEGTDLSGSELAEAMERAGAPGIVAAAYRRYAADRSGMIFCPSVESAHTVAEAVRDVGITAATLSGKTPKTERRKILDAYRAGKIQVITNAMLLGEGVDAPITSCVVVARPTMSKILFRQMVGRGLRLHPSKTDCLILDVVGATGRNDLKTLNDISDVDLDVAEGEGLDEAAKRAIGEPVERAEVVGEAMVSGSLAAIDVDPWAIEEARTRPRNSEGKPMTDEEIEAERQRKQEEARAKAEEKERRERRRYKHVPMRSGWFLRTPGDRWFIPLETAAGQQGFVVIVPRGPQFVVAMRLDGVERRELRVFDHESDAVTFALEFVLKLIEEAVERYKVDPDARWRRKEASPGQINYARRLVSEVDFDEYHYAGQVGDFISWGKWHSRVDKFADGVATEVMAVLGS